MAIWFVQYLAIYNNEDLLNSKNTSQRRFEILPISKKPQNDANNSAKSGH